MRVQFSQAASYSPYYQLVLGQSAPLVAAAEIPSASADYSVARQKVANYVSGSGLTYQLSRRAMVTFGYGLQYTDFIGARFQHPSRRRSFEYVLATTSLRLDGLSEP
jgi:hypothetical protein